jgi:hypothetical protein
MQGIGNLMGPVVADHVEVVLAGGLYAQAPLPRKGQAASRGAPIGPPGSLQTYNPVPQSPQCHMQGVDAGSWWGGECARSPNGRAVAS